MIDENINNILNPKIKSFTITHECKIIDKEFWLRVWKYNTCKKMVLLEDGNCYNSILEKVNVINKSCKNCQYEVKDDRKRILVTRMEK